MDLCQRKMVSPVALVTGAAGAIGNAVVRRLKADGWKVAGIDLIDNDAEFSLCVDLTNRVAMAEAAAQVTEGLGSIELLMTAPEAYEAAPIGEIEADRWQRLLDLWLGGTVNACAAVLPSMLKAGCGTIVTLSVDLTQNSESEAYYAAATGTITGFTKSLALEVAAAGVRVNCIAPRRPVNLEGVAETVVFLATEGDFYVGQILFLCPKGGVL